MRCLKRLISPGAPSLEAFYTHVISAPSLHRASTDALTRTSRRRGTHENTFVISKKYAKINACCSWLREVHSAGKGRADGGRGKATPPSKNLLAMGLASMTADRCTPLIGGLGLRMRTMAIAGGAVDHKGSRNGT